MPHHYTDEQKANRKKGGMQVQYEQVDKYRQKAQQKILKEKMRKLREPVNNPNEK
tara:strand:+ start:3122 stop:3286 length:165 start_codon:yes stop_codon:yes gene_type:complete